jgi:hypothetical protein
LKKAPVVWVLPSYPGSVELNENFKFLSENFDTILKQRAIDEGQFLDLKSKAAFLSSLYCCADNKQSVYRLTATFHNEFCRIFSKQASRKIDGLLYPSANTKGEGMNVVFDKDYIQDENVICDHAVLYHYLRDPNNNKSISFLPIAACNPQLNGNLSFIPLTDDDLR